MNIAFIPARKGSKGIPGKNKKNFCGKPLVQWSIDQAKESKLFEKIIVSSDDNDILDIAKKCKVEGIKRDKKFATDEARIDDLMLDYFSKVKCDHICLLQPTSPLRSVKDIRESYKHILSKKWWSVVGVTWNPLMGWVKEPSKAGSLCLYQVHKRPNRQTRDNFFLENGAIYWMKHNRFVASGNRIGSPIYTYIYEMPIERSLEVDTPLDWFIAEKTYEWVNK